MSEFRQYFLSQSLSKLQNLREQIDLSSPDVLHREAFRVVHTIKGGAQTFGLNAAAAFAAELETLMASHAGLDWLPEALARLADRLRDDFQNDDVLGRIKAKSLTETFPQVILTRLPKSAFDRMAASEKSAFADLTRQSRRIFISETTCGADEIARLFGEFRKSLGRDGEVLATFVHQIPTTASVNVRFLAASGPFEGEARDQFPATSLAVEPDSAMRLREIIATIGDHLTAIREKTGKTIALNVFANPIELSDKLGDALFTVILHLVRNAADHGILKTGTIDISIFEEDSVLYVSVADDGRGVDFDSIRAKAVAQKMILAEDPADNSELLALIFEHGFSTGEKVTEISGRGVGLDAVKDAVERLNGKISVRNRKIGGTVFEIAIPLEI